MTFEPTLLGSIGSVVTVPLLFGGDLIELAILFLILAVVAGVLGARGVAGLSMTIAKWLIIIFVLLAIVSFLL
ncbi:MAG: DUF1328 domain-containing protein [Halobacteriales archaeon]